MLREWKILRGGWEEWGRGSGEGGKRGVKNSPSLPIPSADTREPGRGSGLNGQLENRGNDRSSYLHSFSLIFRISLVPYLFCGEFATEIYFKAKWPEI